MKSRVSPIVATTRELREIVSREHGHDIDRLIDHLMEQQKAARECRRGRSRSAKKQRG